ncbi:ParA family protein [Kocuria sp. KH4]
MDIVAVAAQKGGVGKTTTTYHLTRAAARAGLRVLAVDADPQGNLTSALAAEPPQPEALGVADTLNPEAEHRYALDDVIVPAVWEGVDLAPTSGEALTYIEDELTQKPKTPENSSRLKANLATMADRYDLVIIDCPPNRGALTVNALVAATQVLVVTMPALYAANGVAHIFTSIQEVQKELNPELINRGVLLNLWEPSTIASREWRLWLAETYGDQLLEPYIPKREAVKTAQEAGMGLDELPKTEELVRFYDAHLQRLLPTRVGGN